MNNLTLSAEKRELVGRKVKVLRKKGILPANVYGRKIKSFAVQIEQDKFSSVYNQAGETGLVELVINKDKKPVLIHHVQIDPVTDALLHVDFLQVDLKQKVTAKVPIELIGESPVEKQGLGTVVQYFNELEVVALPTDLPDKFEIDLNKLIEVDQAIQVKDLAIDSSKVEIKSEPEQILIKVEPPRAVEEEVAPAAEEVTAEEVAETPQDLGEQEEKPAVSENPEK